MGSGRAHHPSRGPASTPRNPHPALPSDSGPGKLRGRTRPELALWTDHLLVAAETPFWGRSWACLPRAPTAEPSNVLHAEVTEDHRQRGIATMLYDRIESILGTQLKPSGWLSDDAYQFWQRRDPKLVQWHRKYELPGLWVSPKTLLNLLAITQARLMQGIEGGPPN